MNHLPLFCLLIAALISPYTLAAQPEALRLDSIRPAQVTANNEITLLGSGFSASNPALEIIADYGGGLHYALKITRRSDNRISAILADIGKSLQPKIFLQRANQRSRTIAVTLKPLIRADPQTPPRQHQLMVGDKGEDIYKVVNKAASCLQPGEVFDHASIKFLQKRFAEAQFVALPEAGCTRCKDIRVRWYNEPTGVLRYQLIIYHRQIQGVCRQRLR